MSEHQGGLFDHEPADDRRQRTGMPKPYATILVHFATPADRAEFQRQTRLRIHAPRRFAGQVWYPAVRS